MNRKGKTEKEQKERIQISVEYIKEKKKRDFFFFPKKEPEVNNIKCCKVNDKNDK